MEASLRVRNPSEKTKQNSNFLFEEKVNFPRYWRNIDLQEALEDIFEQFDTNETNQGL